jgi:hypothetical protein
MRQLQNDKVRLIISAQSVTAGATVTSKAVDAIGAGCVSIYLGVVSGTTSCVPVQIRVQHSDTTADSNYSSITGYTANTSSSGYPSAVASTATDATNLFGAFHVDMRGKKRYLRLLLDGPAATNFTAFATAILGDLNDDVSGTNTGALFNVNPA